MNLRRWTVGLGLAGILSGSVSIRAQAPPPAAAQKTTQTAGELPAVEGVDLSTDRDKACYGLGLDIARRLSGDGMDINLEAFIQGLRDARGPGEPKITQQEFVAAMRRFQEVSAQQLAAKNQAEGEAYLAKNAQRPGVKKLPSGLQYEVVQEGQGPSPKKTDSITAHYRGTFIDGREFDSSYNGDPLRIGVSGVIPGWTEALQKMKVGEKWKMALPPQLGYGADGAPPDIGPNTVLLFEIELLSIE